jgi:hypothetical protein
MACCTELAWQAMATFCIEFLSWVLNRNTYGGEAEGTTSSLILQAEECMKLERVPNGSKDWSDPASLLEQDILEEENP